MQHTLKVAGLVLAGGQGRRMHGADKAFMKVDKRPCIDWVITRLKTDCAGIAISANGNAQRFAPWGCPVLADTLQDTGPLAGLLRGLEWAEATGFDVLVSIPVDTPLIPSNLIKTLLPAASYATYGEQRHSLVAAWPVRSARALLASQLANISEQNRKQNTRVCTLAHALDARAVDYSSSYSADPFLNINTPEDLLAVKAILQNQNKNNSNGQ